MNEPEIKESFNGSTLPVRDSIPKEDRIGRFLNLLFKGKVIRNCDYQLYLYRWYVIRTEPFALFVHRFVRSDEDRALHDHPWNFIVIPIWRGYREHNVKGVRRVLPILGIRYRRARYRHKVELIDGKPAWSLFIRFRYRRVWGFWPKEGFKNWRQWWSDLCED